MKVYCYERCTTCKKALKWLDDNKIKYELIDIKGSNPDKAIIKAAINVQKRHPDWKVVPEIMIPLVGEVKELKFEFKQKGENNDGDFRLLSENKAWYFSVPSGSMRARWES